MVSFRAAFTHSVVGALAILTLFGCAPSSASPSEREPPPTISQTRTPPPSLRADTLDDAVRLVSGLFTGEGSTLSVARPESVRYVQTTEGRAQAMFDLKWDVSDDTPVWVIVAHGEFVPHSMGVFPETPAAAATAWVVVVQGAIAEFQHGYNDRHYDLSPLGAVTDLPPARWNP